MLVQAALRYTRGLLLAIPGAWTAENLCVSTLLPETGPPGTKALALALLYNRSCIFQALAARTEVNPHIQFFLMKCAVPDAVWVAYHSGRPELAAPGAGTAAVGVGERGCECAGPGQPGAVLVCRPAPRAHAKFFPAVVRAGRLVTAQPWDSAPERSTEAGRARPVRVWLLALGVPIEACQGLPLLSHSLPSWLLASLGLPGGNQTGDGFWNGEHVPKHWKQGVPPGVRLVIEKVPPSRSRSCRPRWCPRRRRCFRVRIPRKSTLSCPSSEIIGNTTSPLRDMVGEAWAKGEW